MAQKPKWFAAALALASGLAITSSAQVISDFQAFSGFNTTYNNWNLDGSDPLNGGAGYAPTFTQRATGYGVNAQGLGSGYHGLANAVHVDPGAASVTLTLTLNNPSVDASWLGVKFILNDGLGNAEWYGAYTGLWGVDNGSWANGNIGTAVWTGNQLAMTVPLAPSQLTAAQGGDEWITGFECVLDPAYFASGGPVYDITYNSLALNVVPEPNTLALLALGAGSLALARRRGKVS